VASLTQKLNDAKESVDGIHKEYRNEIMTIKDEFNSVINNLKEELKQAKAQSGKDKDGLLTDLQAARNKIKDLEFELADIHKILDTKDKLLKDQYTKFDELNNESKGIKSNIRDKASNYEIERQDLLEKIKEANMSKDVLKAQYSELHNQLNDLLRGSAKKEAELNKQLSDKDNQISSLKSEISVLENKKTEMSNEIEKLNQGFFSQKLDYEEEVKELQSKHSLQLKEKDGKLEELQMELRLLGQQMANSNKDSNSIERELQIKETEIQKLKKETETLTDRVRVLIKEIDTKEQQIANKQKEMDQREVLHESKLAQCHEKYNEYETAIEKLNKEMEQQRKQFMEKIKGEDVLKQLEYEITMLKKSHSEEADKLKKTIEREVRSKMALQNKHKDDLKSYDNQISILNKDIMRKIEEIDKLKRENKTQRDVADLFKADIESNKQSIKDLTQENQDLTTKLSN
jgi:chromosome segregation ATPase